MGVLTQCASVAGERRTLRLTTGRGLAQGGKPKRRLEIPEHGLNGVFREAMAGVGEQFRAGPNASLVDGLSQRLVENILLFCCGLNLYPVRS